jgi:hypothetical protein
MSKTFGPLARRCSLFLIALAALGSTAVAEPFGEFLDELNVSLDKGGRKMTLLNDYRFKDPAGEIWLATKGSTVDGASIPRVFWTLIGGPLDGPYRNASVIHDYFCVTRTKTCEYTHKVFYNGMRAAGVPETKALAMYYAVLAFGPRWGSQERNTSACQEVGGKITCGIVVVNDVERVDIPTTQEDLEDVQKLEKNLQSGAVPSLSDLERMALNKGNPRFPRELRK